MAMVPISGPSFTNAPWVSMHAPLAPTVRVQQGIQAFYVVCASQGFTTMGDRAKFAWGPLSTGNEHVDRNQFFVVGFIVLYN